MAARARQRRGFTLIELLIVLVLIGILSALILPEMRGTMEEALLRSTTRKMINVLNLASSQAVTLNQARQVQIDPVNGRFAIRASAASKQDAPGEEGVFDQRITVRVRDFEQPAQEGDPERDPDRDSEAPAAKEPDRITFFPDGTADSREIVLRDRMGFERVLRVNAITGRVRLIDPQTEGMRP